MDSEIPSNRWLKRRYYAWKHFLAEVVRDYGNLSQQEIDYLKQLFDELRKKDDAT